MLTGPAAAAPEEDRPDTALLEFLGQWDGEEMTWLDEALAQDDEDAKPLSPAKEVKDDD